MQRLYDGFYFYYLHYMPSAHFGFFVFYVQYVQNFINQTWRERYQTEVSQDFLTLLWSMIVSMFTLGGFIGATIGGTLSVKLGRYKQETYIILTKSLFNICFPI